MNAILSMFIFYAVIAQGILVKFGIKLANLRD